jgi:hypothetical protein
MRKKASVVDDGVRGAAKAHYDLSPTQCDCSKSACRFDIRDPLTGTIPVINGKRMECLTFEEADAILEWINEWTNVPGERRHTVH